MANEVKLTLVGDSKSLEQANSDAVGSTDKLEKGFGKTVAGATAFAEGLANLGDTVQGVTDLMHDQAGKADRLAREQTGIAQAAVDLQQAMRDASQTLLDYGQAQHDAKQAGIDLEQALINQKKAQQDYNAAVKEHGKNSIEAKQAQLDLKQALSDADQATLDQAQATQDASQAMLDHQQASVNAASAQLDLNEAQREAGRSGFTRGIEDMGKYMNAFMPIVMLVTGAQWAFNASLFASPITWIVLGIVALIAIVVLLVTHWDTVKHAFEVAWNWIWDKLKAFGHWLWDTFWTNGYKKVFDLLGAALTAFKHGFGVAWDWIKDKALGVWHWFESLPGKFGEAFGRVKNFIIDAFKSAFNMVSNLWNGTVGKLSWTVPSWVPGIGGSTISAPKLPTYHRGGMVAGGPEGTEVLALLQVGERVQTREMQAAEGRGSVVNNITVNGGKFRDGTDFEDWLNELRNFGRGGGEAFA